MTDLASSWRDPQRADPVANPPPRKRFAPPRRRLAPPRRRLATFRGPRVSRTQQPQRAQSPRPTLRSPHLLNDDVRNLFGRVLRNLPRRSRVLEMHKGRDFAAVQVSLLRRVLLAHPSPLLSLPPLPPQAHPAPLPI